MISSEEKGRVVVIEKSQVGPMPDEATLRETFGHLQPEGRFKRAGRFHGLLFANMKSRLSAIAGGVDPGNLVFGEGVMAQSVIAPGRCRPGSWSNAGSKPNRFGFDCYSWVPEGRAESL